MPDVFTKEKRSEVMGKIKGKDTRIERMVARWLHQAGLRYRKHNRSIPGSPDISIKKYKIAIFVHGCFWHGHPGCKKYKPPQSRSAFWAEKIARNQARDRQVFETLKATGWHVFLVWECEIEQDFDFVMHEMKTKMDAIMA
ncbi:MAG: DNA mismatch endonuclease Vsr [Acholeplasmataceae bacterium]|nr:MAG: DNA mismatch endonuclease Vsr [Acholeplasmataceae bacterium]